MQKLNDEIEIDQDALSAARARLALLTDLFVGAGHGDNLNLSEAGLVGLTQILRECGDALSAADESIAAVVVARHDRTAMRAH
jgi:hypothetical protein